MKNVWKVFAVVICAGSLLCACGEKEKASGTIGDQQTQQTQASTAVMERGDADSALATLCGAIQAQTTEEMAKYVTGADESKLQQLVEHYPKDKGDVTVEYVGSYKNYDMFMYSLSYNGETFEEGMLMLQPEMQGYKLCLDSQIQQDMIDHCQCSSCSGAGSFYSGGMTCGICAGTGMQYYPNVYFDGNMWQGQYMGCSGCGGAGHIGGTWTGCVLCGGSGWRFN